MILDKRSEFSDSQAVTASAISSVVDLGATPTLRDIAGGRPLHLIIQVDVAAVAAGGASNVTFSLESDSTADLATSATVHAQSAAIPKATLVAGYQIRLPLPVGANYERYLGVRYTVDTNDLTAGNFSAFITDAPQANNAYPNEI
jgi:hypothetical protein